MGLSIGEVAKRTQLSIHTLRFYEREGILADPIRRDSAGRRVYADNDVDWLRLCTILRGSGMPIPAIRRYTELCRDEGTERDRLDLLHEHRRNVLAQIRGLTEALEVVEYKVAVYEDYLDGAGEASEAGDVKAS